MIVMPHPVKTHTLWVSEIGSSQSPYAVYISLCCGHVIGCYWVGYYFSLCGNNAWQLPTLPCLCKLDWIKRMRNVVYSNTLKRNKEYNIV